VGPAADGMGNSTNVEAKSFHDKYVLEHQIGNGSQGKVHLCVEKETKQTYAVKVSDRSSRSEETYKREVELCQACDNSSSSSTSVIRVLEEFVDNSHCYVVMELFQAHLRKGLKWVASEMGQAAADLGDAALKNLVRQVSGAIAHMHTCAVVHRDVKAHNLLVDRMDLRDTSCRIVLADLGLARRLEPGRVLSAQVGTRKYWAPEMYDRRYWHAVDVFALGVTFFLTASCAYPFYDETQTRKRDVVAEGAVPRSLDPKALHFLTQVLQKDPTLRPASSQLVEHPWFGNGDPMRESSSRSQGHPYGGGSGHMGPTGMVSRCPPLLQVHGKQLDVHEPESLESSIEQPDLLLDDMDGSFGEVSDEPLSHTLPRCSPPHSNASRSRYATA